eukprot:12920225-Prorocentrum_lima.AAC.1
MLMRSHLGHHMWDYMFNYKKGIITNGFGDKLNPNLCKSGQGLGNMTGNGMLQKRRLSRMSVLMLLFIKNKICV